MKRAAHANPFCTARVYALAYRPQGDNWATLLERLAALDYRGAVVGPMGSGKTTLLQTLPAHLPAARRCLFFRVPRRQLFTAVSTLAHLLPGLTPSHFLLLDEAGRLPRPVWWWLRRRIPAGAGVALAAHRPGRLPTWVRCAASPALLQTLVEEATNGRSPFSAAALTRVYHRRRGNLRAALADLYEMYADGVIA
jgi:energy-coupling factor transporter ATP-binding protein EcfA2